MIKWYLILTYLLTCLLTKGLYQIDSESVVVTMAENLKFVQKVQNMIHSDNKSMQLFGWKWYVKTRICVMPCPSM